MIAELRRGAPWERLPIPDEEYLKVAVTTLLPQYYGRPADEEAGGILRDMAAAIERRHGDAWLRDVLRTPHSSAAGEAFAALGRAVQVDEAGDRTFGGKEAERAETLFRSVGSEPGVLRAEYERLYTLQLLGILADCARSAGSLRRSLRERTYPWLRTQSLIDDLSCQAWLGNFEGADEAAHAAERAAEISGYRVLSLRARGMHASVLAQFGNVARAWRYSADGLETYWSAGYPLLRAQHFYSELAPLAVQVNALHAAAALARSTVELTSLLGDPWFHAGALRRLAVIEASAGLPDARMHLKQSVDLLARLPYGQWRRAVVPEQMEIAGLEASLGDVDASLARLIAIQPQALLSEPIKKLSFYSQLGVLRLRRSEIAEARRLLDLAIEIGEGTRLPASDADRVFWMRTLGVTYRARVECEVGGGTDPRRSWMMWSRYRDALFDRAHAAETKPNATVAPSHAVLSFAEMPLGIGVWLGNESGFRFRMLDTPDATMQDAMRTLVRGCSSRKTPAVVLRAQARQVSVWLLGSWERELDNVRELVIEGDGPFSELPWPALVRSNGRYWSEDFSIRIRVGASCRSTSEPNGLLEASAKALIVGAPMTAGDPDLTPLPDAVEEAERIHSLLPRSMLLEGPEATLSKVRALIEAAELFHFAGHGYGGEGGGLVLTGANGGPALLTASDIGGRDLSRCRLVVLSGCATGSGERAGPGDPRSLVRAFLRAGSREVLASSWDLDSAGTSAFVREFYRAMLSGAPAAESLRKAGAVVRSSGVYTHPYYWAGLEVFSAN